MEPTNLSFPWLALIDRPAFCVKDGVIAAMNSAAEHQSVQIGTAVSEIVTDNYEQYASLENGTLSFAITVEGVKRNATITRTKEYDVFVLNSGFDDNRLQALALAAKQLRIPLSNVMLAADQLVTNQNLSNQKQAHLLNQGFLQLLRIIGNMSDAGTYQQAGIKNMETVNFTAVFDEVMEKIHTSLSCSNIQLHYTGLDYAVFGLGNSEKLERAIYNLLSNALKFTAPGGTVEVELTKKDHILSFAVTNSQPEQNAAAAYWNQYQREPAIEESRFGLGLGMSLIQATAISHGGTVLIDHPAVDKIRVTMTITIKQDHSGNLRSPVIHIGDYAGGRDKSLLELSEFLPADAYEDVH